MMNTPEQSRFKKLSTVLRVLQRDKNLIAAKLHELLAQHEGAGDE